jgi:uncharacterized iron-regulated protein
MLALILALVLGAAVVRPSFAAGEAMRLSDGQVIDLGQMLVESRNARVYFLAEIHETSWHHAAQLAIIKELRHQGGQLAIGLEMFTADSQAALDRWTAGKLPLKQFRELYDRNWTLPWSLYEEIFLYARDNRIPLIGLNLPLEISRKVARQGFAALTPQERRKLPTGITCTVGPAYMTFIRQAYANHGLQDKAFTHFCEAQLLWNRNMGRQLERYLTRHPRRTVVVLTGTGHALKKGIPDEISVKPDRFRVILPETVGLNRNNLNSQDADYLLLVSPDHHD